VAGGVAVALVLVTGATAVPAQEGVGTARGDTTPRLRLEESLFFRGAGAGIGELTLAPSRTLSRVAPTEFARAPFLYDDARGPAPKRTLGRHDEFAFVGDRDLPLSLRLRDRVYLSPGSWTVEPGDRLQAVRWEERVPGHGRIARPVAILRVQGRIGATAVAEVSELYGFYRVGAAVLPLPEAPDLQGGEVVSADVEVTARLVGPAVRRPLVVPGATVFLSAGSRSGVRPGDEFVVASRLADPGERGEAALRLRVIRVGAETSTARVLRVWVPDIPSGIEVCLD
jgi:hypothetical protein